jgi:hypothetical protein
MLLRLVQGQWPPVSRAVTPAEIAHNEICSEYAQWMITLRGLAPQTVSHRRDEAARFLDWLGDRAAKEGLALLTTVDVDGYMSTAQDYSAGIPSKMWPPKYEASCIGCIGQSNPPVIFHPL